MASSELRSLLARYLYSIFTFFFCQRSGDNRDLAQRQCGRAFLVVSSPARAHLSTPNSRAYLLDISWRHFVKWHMTFCDAIAWLLFIFWIVLFILVWYFFELQFWTVSFLICVCFYVFFLFKYFSIFFCSSYKKTLNWWWETLPKFLTIIWFLPHITWMCIIVNIDNWLVMYLKMYIKSERFYQQPDAQYSREKCYSDFDEDCVERKFKFI